MEKIVKGCIFSSHKALYRCENMYLCGVKEKEIWILTSSLLPLNQADGIYPHLNTCIGKFLGHVVTL